MLQHWKFKAAITPGITHRMGGQRFAWPSLCPSRGRDRCVWSVSTYELINWHVVWNLETQLGAGTAPARCSFQFTRRLKSQERLAKVSVQDASSWTDVEPGWRASSASCSLILDVLWAPSPTFLADQTHYELSLRAGEVTAHNWP